MNIASTAQQTIRWAIFSLATGICVAGLAQEKEPASGEARTLADEMPRIPPTEPKDALKTFEVQKGFTLELVASEPMVSDPVDACFDENGRMFVAEMHGYPFSQEPTRLNPKGGGKPDAGIVRLLEDTDGDGKMDRSVVFADRLRWPTSVCCYGGGVFVLAPPTLWWFKDTTGDGKADVRHRVFDGFNRDNVQAVANNMKWGLDHRIYVAGGRNPSVITKDGKELLKLGRVDFSFDPLTETVRPETGGVQFGHCFDDWGNRFVCSNSNHIQHVVVPYEYTSRETWSGPPAIRSIAVEGAAAPVFRRSPAEPWRIVRTRRRNADPKYARLPPTEKVPIGFFTSATSVTIYRGDAWPEEYRGQAFIGDVGGNLVHRKILEPDGVTFKARRADQNCEFIASTDNWFRPTNFVNAPDGTLYILDMYRETIEHPYSIPDDIKEHLDLESGSDRGRIFRLVAENGVRKPVEKLGDMTLDELAGKLSSQNAWARETASRLLWEAGDRSATRERVTNLFESKDPLARLHALYAISDPDVRDKELAAKQVSQVMGDPDPRVRRHAIWLASTGRFPIRTRPPKPEPADAMTLFAMAARFPADEILFSQDPYVSAAGASFGLGVAAIREAIEARKFDADRLFLLSRLSSFSEDLKLIARNSTKLRRDREVHDRILTLMKEDRIADPVKLQIAGAMFPRIDLGERVHTRAMKALTSGKQADRLFAIRLLKFGGRTQRDYLLSLMGPGEEPAVQIEACRSAMHYFVESEASDSQKENTKLVQAVLSAWQATSPSVRAAILGELLSSIPRTNALLDELESGTIRAAEIDRNSKKALTGHAVSSIAARSRKLFGSTENTDRSKVIVRYQPALEKEGSPAEGRKLFLKNCSVCHKVGDQGHQVAPDIVSVVNKSPDDLLIAILDPNREAQPNFTQYTVITKAGKVFNGMIAAETGASLTLRRAEGKQDVIRRADIAELVSSGKSLMPEGFEKELSPEQMRDIIRFVKSLGVKKSDQKAGG